MTSTEQRLDRTLEEAYTELEMTVVRARGDRPPSVRLSGELDMAGCPRLDLILETLAADGAREVVVDLSRLGFIDCSGIRALLAASERARRAGRRLPLVPGMDGVQRVFALTGTEALLDFLPDGRRRT